MLSKTGDVGGGALQGKRKDGREIIQKSECGEEEKIMEINASSLSVCCVFGGVR